MCYNIAVQERKLARFFERYRHLKGWSSFLGKTEPDERELPEAYFVSGFEHSTFPFIKEDRLHFLKWGLIPSWTKDLKAAKDIRTKTLNAIGETVFEKPSFRNSIKSKRGLLPVTGFYEWMDFNKKKFPYFIKLKNEDIFSLGCIYEEWVDKNTGEIFNTFSIITTPANRLMEKIHNVKKRMPLIINKEDEEKWLDSSLSIEEVKDLIKPFGESVMEAYTVSDKINSARNHRNIPDSLIPVEYPELIFAQ